MDGPKFQVKLEKQLVYFDGRLQGLSTSSLELHNYLKLGQGSSVPHSLGKYIIVCGVVSVVGP